jgi:hypothetical protein
VVVWRSGCCLLGVVTGVQWSSICGRYSITVAVDLRRMEEQALWGQAWGRG